MRKKTREGINRLLWWKEGNGRKEGRGERGFIDWDGLSRFLIEELMELETQRSKGERLVFIPSPYNADLIYHCMIISLHIQRRSTYDGKKSTIFSINLVYNANTGSIIS